jgi:twitching motility protein PilT
MLATPAVRSLVRESKVHQIYSVIQTSQKEGMKTMNQSLYELYASRQITLEDATARTTDPEEFERLFKRGG